MRKSVGWYLGLRYMSGEGLVARCAEKIGAEANARFIFADGVLLSSAAWRDVLLDWFLSLAIGGHLILWAPDCRYADSDGARVTLDDLSSALDGTDGWCLRESDLIDGHAFVVWQRIDKKARYSIPWRKQPKHVLIARTGAYGDALMASSVLPYLKENGWTISFVTRAAGEEVLRHDPHIDEVITIADGQLTEDDMPYYWQAMARRYDRFINLTHSVEGELLKHPQKADYFWADDQRRRLCSRSYLRQTHDLADVPGPYRVRFYPSIEERKVAENLKQRTGGYVLWSLRGSAVHKWWPYTPMALCQLLSRTTETFVLTGGYDAEDLEHPIQKAVEDYHGDTSRVQFCIGTHSIREVMALAQQAKLVIGPETGVMNAVSMEVVPKLVLLSHSSPRNLTDDWVNAEALCPVADCYPCHRLHYGHDWCPQDKETGAAKCAASLSITRVVNAARTLLQRGTNDQIACNAAV